MIDPLIGQTFGQYELQERLGQGGMAAVYRAAQPALGRAVAVKVLPLAQIPDPTLPERFRREARLAANLLHPNIVPVYDFGEWQGYLYIVMALIAGGTLKDRLHGPMPAESAVRLVIQVADALGYAHGQGVFHRDVKPANILLAPGDWAMLSDFGIARALGETTRLTGPYGTIGTPAYMAPEQWLGGDVDGRADLYALGIILYELLAGSPPFPATTAPGLMRQHLEMLVPRLPAERADLPAGLNDVLQTVLAKQPDRRYRHAAELKSALEAVMRQPQAASLDSRTNLAVGLGPAAAHSHLEQTMRVSRPIGVPAPPVEPPRRAGGSSTMLVVLIMILVVLLAGTVGYIVASSRGATSSTQAPAQTSVTAVDPPTSAPVPPTGAAALPTSAPAGQPLAPTPAPAVSSVVAQAAATAVPTPAPPTAAPPPPATEMTPAPLPTATAPPPPTATAPPPPTATMPPPTATAPPQPTTTRPAAAQPTAPAKTAPSPTTAPDQRRALVERHVGDYFAALNAGDYAKAQAACCTPAWRSRYPLDDWRKNFAGVTDLRFATPFRYTVVEAGRIVAEIDYSFANSSGSRRDFTLRWTFVPVGNDWLADDAVAFPRQ
jgi:hypothetical protein